MLQAEIKYFLKYYKISDFTDKSIETFRIRLNEFKAFLKNTKVSSLRDISYQHLRGFVAEFKNPSVHIKKARVWTLHQFFHFLKLNGWVDDNIALAIPYPKIEKTIPHFLTIEENNRILGYFHEKATDFRGLRNLVIIMMLGFLGLRLSVILSLNIDDVDIETGLIWFSDKGRQERMLIMPEVLCLVLSQYLDLHDKEQIPLFLSKRNKRISQRTLQKIFQEAMNALGIEKHLHAHLFRHTAATHLNRVSDLVITQHVLGHARQNNTEKYAHLNPDIYVEYMKRHPLMKGE